MKPFNFIKGCLYFFLYILIFVGCNNSDNNKTQSNVVEQDNYKPQTHTIEIKDMKFQPENLTVHNGDTVVWINKDIVAHDVTEENKAWTSSPLANEASFKKAITESVSYYCSIHVVMKGKLTVE